MAQDIRVSFRLKAGRDDDLISWFESISANDRSYHIRETLRGSLIKGIPQDSLHLNNIERSPNAVNAANSINKPVNKEKPIAEISEDELEKNLRGWMD